MSTYQLPDGTKVRISWDTQSTHNYFLQVDLVHEGTYTDKNHEYTIWYRKEYYHQKDVMRDLADVIQQTEEAFCPNAINYIAYVQHYIFIGKRTERGYYHG